MSKTRLEAFSDGVFAIIVTIMVLEIKIPHGTDWNSIAPILPTLGSYAISFLLIGNWWINHHHVLQPAKQVNAKIMFANLNSLFWLSLMPIATGWMGETGFAPVTVAVYGVLLSMSGLAFYILSVQVAAGSPEDHHAALVFRRMRRKGTWSFVLFLSSIPAAFLHPAISCAMFAVTFLIWTIPDKKIEKLLIGG